jgi:chromosome segregation ATPase
MLKKIGITALAVAAGLFILSSTRLGSYAKTFCGKAREWTQSQITPEFELANARREVAELVPEMRKHVDAIAKETVEVKTLRSDIKDMQVKLEAKKENLRAMLTELKSDRAKVSINGYTLTKAQLKAKLDREVSLCEECEKQIQVSEKTLAAREQSLQVAREQLDSMRHQKDELEVQIANLEAELRSLRLAQTKSNFKLDDSKLSRIKESLKDVRKKIETEREAMALAASFEDGTLTTDKKAKDTGDVIKRTEAFLNGKPAAEEQVAAQQ